MGRGGHLTVEFTALAGLPACRVFQTRPRDPEAKGLVERANGYLETSFLPGRTFAGPDDFNAQLTGWLAVANRRHHRRPDARPADRWEADRARMLPLPPTSPPCWWHTSVRLGRDHYVRVDTCDYSIHPRAIGRKVAVVVTTEQVIAYCDGQVVARRPRCWARHQTLTDAEHARAAAALRGEYRNRLDARLGGACATELVEVEQRRLEVYDRAFTVIDGGGEDDEPGAEVS